ANLLARRLVILPHRPGGQAQYVEMPLQRHEDDSLAPLLHRALEHLDERLTIDQLAAHQKVTPRPLTQRFRAATGLTPLQWLLAQRVRRARQITGIDRPSAGVGSPRTVGWARRKTSDTTLPGWSACRRRSTAGSSGGRQPDQFRKNCHRAERK